MSDVDLPVIEHLAELRKRLITIIVPLLISITVFYYKAPLLISFLKKPISGFGLEFAFFSMTEAFIARLKLATLASLIILSPLILYQILAFIGPGLRGKEKRLLYTALLCLSITFASGAVFSYVVLTPYTLNFLISYGESYMTPVLSGDRYLSFIAILSLVMGITFTIPVILIFLAKLGLLNSKMLRKARKYIILVLLAVEGIIVPAGDLIAYVLIAAPVIVLYELSIWIVFFMERKRKRAEKLAMYEETNNI
ncbi:MAG: twin-arginine translocase subunit TatC [Clostridia bacterium]|nr:twin-arginine translocase subunit TatC [Clostridia bacterium]